MNSTPVDMLSFDLMILFYSRLHIGNKASAHLSMTQAVSSPSLSSRLFNCALVNSYLASLLDPYLEGFRDISQYVLFEAGSSA